MKRLLSLTLVAALAVTASACNVSPVAATVDGQQITQSQLNQAMAIVMDSAAADCSIEMQGQQLSNPNGVGTSSATALFAGEELQTLVNNELISFDLAKRHVAVTSDDIAAGRQDFLVALANQNGSAPQNCPTGQQLYDALPATFAQQQVQSFAEIDLLLATMAGISIGPSALQAYYSAHQSAFAETCLSAIVVSSQAQANSIRAAVVAGSSFATEAQQNSLDQTTAPQGGAIGCPADSAIATNSAVSQQLTGLGINQVSQPFEQQNSDGSTSWVLLEVTGRTVQAYSQVTSQIRNDLLSPHSSLLQPEAQRLLSSANVTVDPRYGQWQGAKGISAPVPPPMRFVLSPAADQPSLAAPVSGLSLPSGS